jgi:hypothetical protein
MHHAQTLPILIQLTQAALEEYEVVQATTEESNNQQILIKRQNVKLPVETLGSKAHASTPVAALLLTQVAALLTQVAALLTQVAALLLTQVALQDLLNYHLGAFLEGSFF